MGNRLRKAMQNVKASRQGGIKPNPKFILRQAQDDGLKMLKNKIMVSLSNRGFWTLTFIWHLDFVI